MKIMLLGQNGQIGRELARSLLPLGHVIALGHKELNLRNTQALQETLETIKPQLIVNAAAYTAVDRAEVEHLAAHEINVRAVEILATYTKKLDALLIHYSTDYVFNGKKPGPYVETDKPDPLNMYGLTKWEGEKAIMNTGCHNLIIRTSWVYSAFGHNFIKTILNKARNKTSLSVVEDQQGAPTSAELIADVTASAIIAYQQGRLHSGLYHLTPSGVTNWYLLACYVVDKIRNYGINLALEPSQIQPIPSLSYPLPANRPKNSLLDSTRLSNHLSLLLPNWTTHVDRVLHQLIQLSFFNET